MENGSMAAGSENVNANNMDFDYSGVSVNFMTFIPKKIREKTDKERKAPGVTGLSSFTDFVEILKQETMELKVRDYDEKDFEKDEDQEKE